MDDVADVSEVHAASIVRVLRYLGWRVSVYVCQYNIVSKKQPGKGEMEWGFAPHLGRGSLYREGCADAPFKVLRVHKNPIGN
jgi:hypothetical protein